MKDRRGLRPEEGKARMGTGKGGGGLLTLCLNSDFSSRVMVSALAMTGMMFTTLLRCFMNSRSRGRKLRPREGGVSEPPCPPPLSHCHHSRGTLVTGGLGWELAEAKRLLPFLSDTHPPSQCAEETPTLHAHMVHHHLFLFLGSHANPAFFKPHSNHTFMTSFLT